MPEGERLSDDDAVRETVSLGDNETEGLLLSVPETEPDRVGVTDSVSVCVGFGEADEETLAVSLRVLISVPVLLAVSLIEADVEVEGVEVGVSEGDRVSLGDLDGEFVAELERLTRAEFEVEGDALEEALVERVDEMEPVCRCEAVLDALKESVREEDGDFVVLGDAVSVRVPTSDVVKQALAEGERVTELEPVTLLLTRGLREALPLAEGDKVTDGLREPRGVGLSVLEIPGERDVDGLPVSLPEGRARVGLGDDEPHALTLSDEEDVDEGL